MTIADLVNWCKDKNGHRIIFLMPENRELEYTDIGLKPLTPEEKTLFDEE